MAKQAVASTNSAGDRSQEQVGYTVLARRYRPQQFDECVGQEHVVDALKLAIEHNRVAHAYLFTGPRGVGKTTTARILAKALNCVRGPTATPCDQCDICKAIASGEDVDVIEVDGASNRGIDEIRDMRQKIQFRPSRARFKIYIIDEVHMLSKEAFNALLKTLEEPPSHVKFLFATTEVQKIPITILSRCQRFDLGGIGLQQIVQRLTEIVHAEGMTADHDAIEFIARRGAGSMRDSQSLLDQCLAFCDGHLELNRVHAVLGTASNDRVSQLADAVLAGETALCLELVDQAIGQGVQIGEWVEQMLEYFRDLLVLTVDPKSRLVQLPTDLRQRVEMLAGQLSPERILEFMDFLSACRSRMKGSTYGRTILEMTLVRMARIDQFFEVAKGAMGATSGSAGRPAVARPPISIPAPVNPPVSSPKPAVSPVIPKAATPIAPPAAPTPKPVEAAKVEPAKPEPAREVPAAKPVTEPSSASPVSTEVPQRPSQASEGNDTTAAAREATPTAKPSAGERNPESPAEPKPESAPPAKPVAGLFGDDEPAAEPAGSDEPAPPKKKELGEKAQSLTPSNQLTEATPTHLNGVLAEPSQSMVTPEPSLAQAPSPMASAEPTSAASTTSSSDAIGLNATAQPIPPDDLAIQTDEPAGIADVERQLIPLHAGSVTAVWNELLIRLNAVDGGLASRLRSALETDFDATQRKFIVRFAGQSSPARQYCEQAARARQIEQLLTQIAGQPITLRFEATTARAVVTQSLSNTSEEKRRQMARKDPLVAHLEAVLSAKIVRTDVLEQKQLAPAAAELPSEPNIPDTNIETELEPEDID